MDFAECLPVFMESVVILGGEIFYMDSGISEVDSVVWRFIAYGRRTHGELRGWKEIMNDFKNRV